ncbi:hypothetical protein [cf. Phormidesmis sp. LEGE 11477]|uniref:hypothetical protein n=1 Tax=cf. Phormidesmis sp. LEGE 11477 TaxID=1828680 RepID=UPI00187F6F1D|nr:hypothetical protein [cf. Phormidesmis sp. LEGE 11477]MBE9061861.1 hypothetical protein [cf. Phormidesmis sp. LEGE 11477]
MPKANRVPQPASSPDWSAFMISMLADSSYQRISTTAENQLSVSRVETFFSIQGGELAIAVQLWKLMVESVPASMQPVAGEAATWDAIAADNDMPISFDSSGLLVVNDEN